MARQVDKLADFRPGYRAGFNGAIATLDQAALDGAASNWAASNRAASNRAEGAR